MTQGLDAFQNVQGLHPDLPNIDVLATIFFDARLNRDPGDGDSTVGFWVSTTRVDPSTWQPFGNNVYVECNNTFGAVSPVCVGTNLTFTVTDESAGETSSLRVEGTATGVIEWPAAPSFHGASLGGIYTEYRGRAGINERQNYAVFQINEYAFDTFTVSFAPITPGAQLGIPAPEPTGDLGAIVAIAELFLFWRHRTHRNGRSAQSR